MTHSRKKSFWGAAVFAVTGLVVVLGYAIHAEVLSRKLISAYLEIAGTPATRPIMYAPVDVVAIPGCEGCDTVTVELADARVRLFAKEDMPELSNVEGSSAVFSMAQDGVRLVAFSLDQEEPLPVQRDFVLRAVRTFPDVKRFRKMPPREAAEHLLLLSVKSLIVGGDRLYVLEGETLGGFVCEWDEWKKWTGMLWVGDLAFGITIEMDTPANILQIVDLLSQLDGIELNK